MEKTFDQFIEELKVLETNLSTLIDGKLINPKIADDLVLIAQHKVKLFLKDFFDTLFVNAISIDDNSEFIIYSYKSLYGEIPAQTSDKHQLFKRRFNLFSKGKRWSNRTGKKFYDTLDLINEKFSDTPINLLGELSSKNDIRYLTVKTTGKASISSNLSELEFPDFNVLKGIKKSISGENGLVGYLRNYMRNLVENPDDNQTSELMKVEKVIRELDIQKILEAAKSNSELKPFLDNALKIFGIDSEDISSQERFLKAFFTYQLNDLDFNLHLFFPCNPDGVFTSVLMLATKRSLTFSENEIENLCKLTTQLEFLEKLEKKIVEETRKNNEAYIIWKNNYEKEYHKLYTFMVSVENICRSLCTQNDIKYSHISGRVKTFESFYNKIFIRANESVDNIYRKAIDEPHDYFNKIFNIIRDLSGVRVILLFESDLNDIKQHFLKLLKKQDLYFDELNDVTFYEKSGSDADSSLSPEEKSDRWGYRSLHITVSPGKNRLKLTEYDGLSNVKCEIQFRTVLAHAWADVNHDLEYKNREVVKEIAPELQGLLKDDFIKLSKNLYDNDKILIEIKKKNEESKLNLK